MIVYVTSLSGFSLQAVDSDVFLVTFPDVLSGEYAVHLRGEDNTSASRSTPNIFQRQASTQIKTSGISLTVSSADFPSLAQNGPKCSLVFRNVSTRSLNESGSPSLLHHKPAHLCHIPPSHRSSLTPGAKWI